MEPKLQRGLSPPRLPISPPGPGLLDDYLASGKSLVSAVATGGKHHTLVGIVAVKGVVSAMGLQHLANSRGSGVARYNLYWVANCDVVNTKDGHDSSSLVTVGAKSIAIIAKLSTFVNILYLLP